MGEGEPVEINTRFLSLCELAQIEPLWQRLIDHLADQAEVFQSEFKTKTFATRMAPYLAKVKGGHHQIEVVETTDAKWIAYCVSSVTNDRVGEVDSLFVDPTFRHHGIGDLLMEHAHAFFTTHHTVKNILSVSEGNADVMAFYRRHGYRLRYYVMEQPRGDS